MAEQQTSLVRKFAVLIKEERAVYTSDVRSVKTWCYCWLKSIHWSIISCTTFMHVKSYIIKLPCSYLMLSYFFISNGHLLHKKELRRIVHNTKTNKQGWSGLTWVITWIMPNRSLLDVNNTLWVHPFRAQQINPSKGLSGIFLECTLRFVSVLTS